MTDFGTLKSDITAWVIDEDLTSKLPSFVRLCEAEIRRKVRCRDMEQTTTIDCSGRETQLPTGFLVMRSLSKQHESDRALEYMTPEKIREGVEWQGSDGPTAYTIEGDSLILAPAPGSTITLDIVYLKAYDALSDDSDTNWLLTNAYDVYLYGGIWAAYTYVEDAENEAKYFAHFNRVVEELNREQKMSRIGGSSRIRRGVDTP